MGTKRSDNSQLLVSWYQETLFSTKDKTILVKYLQTWFEFQFKFIFAEWMFRDFYANAFLQSCRMRTRCCAAIMLYDPLLALERLCRKAYVFECIKKELAGRTILFVTHQLQYLKDWDEVIILSEGVVAEHGKHEHLMQRKGDYAKLIKYIRTNFGLHSRPLRRLEWLKYVH